VAVQELVSNGRGQVVGETLGALLTEAARRFSTNPALVMKPGVRTRITTYAELERLAERCAHYLRELGIEKGDRVMIWAPNMPQWVGLYFGCLKIGGVVVPLDVRSEPQFAAAVVAQTDPKLIVGSRLTARLTEGIDVPLIELEQIEPLLPDEPASIETSVSPSDLAEIVFTSGTTGDPKGVMLTHGNITANVQGTRAVLPIEERFRLLSLLPLSHMFEQTVGMLAPLSGGARIVYPVSRQPSAIFRTLAENRITMICLVPQALDLFLNAIEREARRTGKEAALGRLFAVAEHLPMPLRRLLFRSIRARLGGTLELMISGGAYLDPALAHRWELMGISVLQGYGATEGAPIIACDRPSEHKPDAVGKAYPGVDICIEADGEILARGPNIFPGYWQNEAASAAVLQDGWYRTGDLGYLDDEAFLHLKGRKKDLIVLANGQKVYPEDIEAELGRHPAVTEAVIVGIEKQRDVEVHAVLLMRDPALAAEALRAANENLADHQRVRGFTVWPEEDFPRTHTLKVKKRDVLDRLGQMADGARADASPAPSPAAAKPIVRLIAELAAIETARVLPESKLDELGLDSLGRVELLSAVEDELGAYVDESLLAPETTVAELETMVAAAQGGRAQTRFVSWPLGPLATMFRELLLQLLVFPSYHLFWRVRVVGQERIRGVEQPVIIAANHHFGNATFGFDPAAIWMALPRNLRMKTCTAGEEHSVFDRPMRGFFARLVNAFPLSKSGNVRGSLEYIGRLLDLGWSVLIFPEGKLTLGGPMQPFLGGTGLIAVEAGTSVIPIYVDVEQESILQRRVNPWRGAVTMYVGDPLAFRPGSSHVEATQRIEAAVLGLEAAAKGGGKGTALVSGAPGRNGAASQAEAVR
jgi:long-chain acyl-CoA synthetase